MITKIIDHGWGPHWPIKQIEKEILDLYLEPLQQSSSRVVVINSTWYGDQQHQQTMAWLRNNSWDELVLVAMLDPAIHSPEWFQEFHRPVHSVGGYDNEHYIAFWAEIAHRFIMPDHDHDIGIPFMCLNRKPHWHRVKFYNQLQQAGIVDRGLVSFGGKDDEPAVKEIKESVKDNDLAPTGLKQYHGIPNDIASLGDPKNWYRHFLNVVTETVFDINKNNFVSEKIFKPIQGHRPFLVYATDGAVGWLSKHGFESYVDDFQDISDLDLKLPENLAPFLKILCDQTPEYWRQKYIDLLPKINYNQERFKGFVQQQQQKIQRGIQCPI